MGARRETGDETVETNGGRKTNNGQGVAVAERVEREVDVAPTVNDEQKTSATREEREITVKNKENARSTSTALVAIGPESKDRHVVEDANGADRLHA